MLFYLRGLESIHKETVSTEAMEQDEDYEGHEALFEFMNQGEECKKELENLFITFEDFQVSPCLFTSIKRSHSLIILNAEELMNH